ncbi:uncharacterized protein LOC131243471 [Magnolia sinica]|uniref:uncharacterized protein LOC131243471 n=1 Tax=Magnolia sinica TaxID=86752 RepID=UPI002659DACF|nr:uncharacterized protein LOC131243471 [Magnolia sinica]
METPSSTRRVTRSQTMTGSNNIPNSRKKEESDKVISRSRKGKCDRSALFDITNDSPIVGLAMGSLKTPNSVAKNSDQAKRTPGSGEVLLRGQVKTLLQKVEEEAEVSKLSFDVRPFPHFQGLLDSPAGILAPTPANTPLISNPLDGGDVIALPIVTMPVAHEVSKIIEISHPINCLKQETSESEDSLVTRALQFDSPGKSENSVSSTISSALTYEGSCHGQKLPDEDDDASVWSVQANASSKGDEGEDDYDEGAEEEGELIDELCHGLRLMCVEEKRGLLEFVGRHTRFIYNSDGEIEGEEVVMSLSASPGILRLKGMPTPEGKHLRFPEEEEED